MLLTKATRMSEYFTKDQGDTLFARLSLDPGPRSSLVRTNYMLTISRTMFFFLLKWTVSVLSQ